MCCFVGASTSTYVDGIAKHLTGSGRTVFKTCDDGRRRKRCIFAFYLAHLPKCGEHRGRYPPLEIIYRYCLLVHDTAMHNMAKLIMSLLRDASQIVPGSTWAALVGGGGCRDEGYAQQHGDRGRSKAPKAGWVQQEATGGGIWGLRGCGGKLRVAAGGYGT